MLRRVFNVPLARAFAVFWMIGFVIFETMAILTFRHAGSGPSVVFVIPAILLFVLGLWTFWRHPWALAIGTLLSAAQIIAAIGCIMDLQRGSFSMQQSFIAAGVDPIAALRVHLVYSLVGSALFLWAAVRFVRR
ncbi:MAG TPA: hypothetical protein VK760_13150 [Candidatus Acidoferrales bacterium]|jgi:hypothetical protein|nr:hypothetical protein [Candidatus Acidoferrales bacterium]